MFLTNPSFENTALSVSSPLQLKHKILEDFEVSETEIVFVDCQDNFCKFFIEYETKNNSAVLSKNDQ